VEVRCHKCGTPFEVPDMMFVAEAPRCADNETCDKRKEWNQRKLTKRVSADELLRMLHKRKDMVLSAD